MIKNKKIYEKSDLNSNQIEKNGYIWWREAVIYIVFAFVVFLVYSNSFNVPFRYDDIPNILENTSLHAKELSLNEIVVKPLSGFNKMRALPMLSFAINFYFGRFDSAGYHFVNIALHLISTILLFNVLRLTLFQYSKRYDEDENKRNYFFLPFWGTMLWAVHPLHTNSVTYIVQRMNLMAMLFSLVCLLLYIKGRMLISESEKSEKKKSVLTLFLFTGCFLSGIMAFLSKQNTFVLPLIILLYEWFFFRKLNFKKKYCLMGVLIIILMIGVASVLCLILYRNHPFGVIKSSYNNRDFNILQRIMTEWRVIWHYISLIILPLPSRMQLVYDYPISLSLIKPVTTFLSLIGILGVIAICLKYARKYPLMVFCIAWFMIFNIVESTVIGLELIYEHRTYIPSAFIIFLTVLLLNRFVKQKLIINIILASVTVIFMYCTFERNRIWIDDLDFWKDNHDKAPNEKRVIINYGNALLKDGRMEEAKRCYLRILKINPDNEIANHNISNIFAIQKSYEKAEKYIRKAIEIRPDYTSAYVILGSILKDTERHEEALEAFSKALQLQPDNPIILANIASVYRDRKQWDKATYYYKKALGITPEMLRASLELGLIYLNNGKYYKAEAVFKNALKYHKNIPDLHFRLGFVSMKLENYDNAVIYFQNTLLLDPEFPKVKEHLAQIDLLRGTTSKATQHYENLILKKPYDYNLHNNLAILYLKSGKLLKAEKHFKKALKLKPDFADALKGIGSIYYMRKEFPNAEYYYLKALEITPRDPVLSHNLGSVYATQGKIQKAVDSYRKALEIKPDYYEAKQNLERVLKKLNIQRD